jgi:hypothetical protein
MTEMHASGSGIRFWAVERGETYRGTCSMVAGGWLKGNGVEGIDWWWWSRWRWRGSPMAGGAGRRWCARGHDGGFGYSPGATALSTCQRRPVLEEGVAPTAQLDQALEAWWHGWSTAAARSRAARSVWLEEQSDGIGSLRGNAWSQLQIPSGLQVKNLINSSKFYLHMIYLNIILH